MGFDNWDTDNLKVLEKVAATYEVKYVGSPIANSMRMQVEQILAGMAESKSAKSNPRNAAGIAAPEIELKNPDGKTLKLSSLKGKVVLIDFWASWCGPCRQENPNVVRAYNKFKDKGFTVFSVSLDDDATAWKRAIKSDGLIWPNHVSDLKKWNSPLPELYGFDGIPYTVLIDKQGKIIGTNLRGPALEQKLNEILK
jgi:thiol-disulfide isomerase/thioredoxin